MADSHAFRYLRIFHEISEINQTISIFQMLEILEEQKLELGAPYIRKKSILASRKSVGNMEDTALEEARKLDPSELQ